MQRFSFDGSLKKDVFLRMLNDAISEGCHQYSLDTSIDLPNFIVSNKLKREINKQYLCDQTIQIETSGDIHSLIDSFSTVKQKFIFVYTVKDNVEIILT